MDESRYGMDKKASDRDVTESFGGSEEGI